MHVTVTAKRLEPIQASPRYAEIKSEGVGDDSGTAGGITILGTRAERLEMIADWVAMEMKGIDLADPEIWAAVSRFGQQLTHDLESHAKDMGFR